MAPPPKSVSAAPIAPPDAAQAAAGEHIFIESDEGADPATAARTPGDTVVLRNPIRRIGAEITFYEEGYLKVTELAKGNADAPFLLDLRFVDPVPKIERVIAMRWLTAAFGSGALAVLAAFLMRFDAFYVFALAAFCLATLAAIGALYVGVYASHERIEFCTLHGPVTTRHRPRRHRRHPVSPDNPEAAPTKARETAAAPADRTPLTGPDAAPPAPTAATAQ